MAEYRFYEIKSKKSQEYVKGLRQISLVCSDHPDIQCFLWLDQSQLLKHLQFVFNEKLIEWFDDRKRLVTSLTNRQMEDFEGIGIQKGVRTIHEMNDDSILQEGISIVDSSAFPESYEILIRPTLTTSVTETQTVG